MVMIISRTVDSIFQPLDETGHVTNPFHIALSADMFNDLLDAKDEIIWASHIMEFHYVAWDSSSIDLTTFDISDDIQ